MKTSDNHPRATAQLERWKKQQERTFEMNAPAGILKLLQHLMEDYNIDPHDASANGCKNIAERMVAWFKQLNKEDCHPTTTWSDFIHSNQKRSI